MEVGTVAKESAYFYLEDMRDPRHVGKIKRELDGIPGVISVAANLESHRVSVDFDNSATDLPAVRERLEKMGFRSDVAADETHIM